MWCKSVFTPDVAKNFPSYENIHACDKIGALVALNRMETQINYTFIYCVYVMLISFVHNTIYDCHLCCLEYINF
jgi:hypothetical protein